VACGTPEEVAQCEASHTGRFLKTALSLPRAKRQLLARGASAKE
jgi:hypothetical protein